VYKLSEEGGYNPTDRTAAWRKTQEGDDHIPIGIIYQVTGKPTLEEQVTALQAGPLALQPFREWMEEDYQALAAEFI
jgi:hypothetical protein